jgi:hypothetical protein
MDARRTPVHPSRRRPWAVRPWTLVVLGLLLMAGTLLQACSDNNGSTGPTFECRELTAPQATAKGTKGSGNVRSLAACTGSPAPSTGFANTSEDILIRVTANPASIEPGRRVTITVLVTNGANGGGAGLPLAGKRVFVNTSTNTVAFGTVDSPSGITNANGIYQTTMIVRCSDAGVVPAAVPPAPEPATGQEAAFVTVDAFVDGASSAANGTSATVSVTGSSGNPPCPGSA